MQYKVKDIPVYYEERGEGRPLLMLHGWDSDHREMLYYMEPHFENRTGWRRIYPDLPGRGKTRGADWMSSQDDILAVMLAFLEGLAPGERFAVAGYSFGGYLARAIVHRRGEQMDGVMLGAPAVETDPAKLNYPPHQVLVQDPEFVAGLREDEQMLLRVAVVQSPQWLTDFRTALKPGFVTADEEFIRRVAATIGCSFDVDNLAIPFPAPALIVAGRQDSICGYREAWGILDNYPRGTFAVLDRAGHGVVGEQRALYHALTNEWLDRVEEYSQRNTPS